MKSSPLSSIDEDLIGACYFLEDFRDEKKLDCLQTFVNCADIIEWIRTYTKGKILYEDAYISTSRKLFQTPLRILNLHADKWVYKLGMG